MRLQFLLLLAAILPVHAEWNRYLMEDARDARTDTPLPNTRAYFTHDAYLHHCENCTPRHKADIQKGEQAEIVKLGDVRGLGVYQATYTLMGEDGVGTIHTARTKSILVETAPDEFHEIFYGEPYNPTGSVDDAKIITAGGDQTLVWVRVNAGGKSIPEHLFFRIDSGGSARVDFEPVWKVASSLLPSGDNLYGWTIELTPHANAFTVRWPVFSCSPIDEVPCHADIDGAVEVDFKLDDDHLTPLGRRHIP
jgi:hypothetical protein